jgi:hypothetical protein
MMERIRYTYDLNRDVNFFFFKLNNYHFHYLFFQDDFYFVEGILDILRNTLLQLLHFFALSKIPTVGKLSNS